MRIEEFVESMKPRNSKERKKLTKTISLVSVRNEGDHYAIMVPKDIMGIPYEGDLYIIPMLMHELLSRCMRKVTEDMLHSPRMRKEDTGCVWRMMTLRMMIISRFSSR